MLSPFPFPEPIGHQIVPAIRKGLLLVLLSFAVLCALPSMAIGAVMWWRASKTWDARERWCGIWLTATLGGLFYAVIGWYWHPLPSLLLAVFVDLSHRALLPAAHSLGLLWAMHLSLAPVCALILEGMHPLTQWVRLLSRREYRTARPKQEQLEALQASTCHSPARCDTPSSPSHRLASPLTNTPPVIPLTTAQVPPLEPLGEFLGGELYEWVHGDQLCIPLDEMKRHLVVLGEPGYGKTITLLRLAAIAVRSGMQVIFIDLKGSTNTAVHFVAVMFTLGIRQQRIKLYPHEPYNGWRGDTKTLYNRLMQMVDSGTHPFYRKLTSSLVSLAVNAPGGPPTHSRDFLRRLDGGWLYRAYAGKADEQVYARQKIKKLVPHLADLSLTFEGFFDGIAGALDGPWGFEDGDAIYVGLDGDAHKEQAALMGNYLLEDCAHYAKHRKGPRHALVIIDEFGVLESTNATDLFERVREPGVSICASAQSYESLGPERDKVVASSSIKILHRCGAPEAIVKYAGERDVATFSHTLEEDEEGAFSPSGNHDAPIRRTTFRTQRQFTMPIEDVQQLAIGKIALITGGLGAWCQVYPPALPADLLREALAFVNAPAVTSSPPITLPLPRAAAAESIPIPENEARRTSAPPLLAGKQLTQEQGREKSKSTMAQKPQVPAAYSRTSAAPGTVTPLSLPPIVMHTPAIQEVTAQVKRPQITPAEDDSPVDY
jgi:hypothetical protein